MPRHSNAAAPPTKPIAFSYVRFSTPEQAAGDSLARQTTAAQGWCERNKVTLDASTTLHDLGTSGFKGKHRENPDRNALASFLKAVGAGKVPRGSYLIIENFDRLTREDLQPALLLVLNLLQDGIRIVQLKPVEMIFDDKTETMQVMLMVMELSRGHGESARKSELLGSAWAAKKDAVRNGIGQPEKKTNRVNGMGVLTHALPGWVKEQNGRPVAVTARAAVVKRIYHLAASGYGVPRIVKLLQTEKVATFGKSPNWGKSYVAKILTDRRALGEFQMRDREGKPEGNPVPGYFPAIVTEDEWLAVRSGRKQRAKMPGRSGEHVNLFAGLLKNAIDGDSYYAITRPGKRRILINTSAAEGRTGARSFPLATLEAAILTCLKEIDPHDILNGDHGPDKTAVLAGELATVETSIAAISLEMDTNGESPALFQRLRAKENRQKELVQELNVAREEAAHPLSESWGEAQSLLGVLSKASDPQDARLRLRSALRRIVDVALMVVVARGRDRLCECQFRFTGGKDRIRNCFIIHRAAKANASERTEGCWAVLTLKHPDDNVPLWDNDFTDPDEVACIVSALESYPVEMMDKLLKEQNRPLP